MGAGRECGKSKSNGEAALEGNRWAAKGEEKNNIHGVSDSLFLLFGCLRDITKAKWFLGMGVLFLREVS